ncbi:MAG: hypothetical protein MK066_05790 [Crocinitomicaceae bacterium]|nr:hypothetical protein [Crocinitomicaceae bacterium]
MKKILISILLCSFSTAYAQQYKTAIGVKGAWSNLDVAVADFSVKHFFDSPNALEINFGGRRSMSWIQVMYAHNTSLGKGVDWYWALGGDVGVWRKNYIHLNNGNQYRGFWLGLDGSLGLEYTFEAFPINVSLDFGPTIRTIPYIDIGVMSGFSCRFAIK